MKRILLLFSALMLSCIALWAHDVEIDGIYYNLDYTNKTAEVTYRGEFFDSYYYEYSESVTIPETITYNSQTYSVTSIGYQAFRGCSYLTSVTIPNSVTSIGEDAFSGCSRLTSVTIPNSVTSIGEDAFYNTGIYNNNSNWDNGVLYIDNCLIKAKSDVVKGSYTIKEGTRIIGGSAFSDCSGLTSITIPNSVTSIGSYACYRCSGLTEVIWNAKNCAEFEVYFETPFHYIRSSITSFTFGNEVEHIPAYLCYDMENLKKVTIGGSVTSIGEYTFSGCSGLTEVTIPNNVTSIGEYTFSRCSGLTEVTIPNNVTSIGEDAFFNCSGLTEVTIGNSVTSFGFGAFNGCSGLTSVIWNAKHCKDFGHDSYYVGINSPFDDIRSNITSFTFGNEVEHIPAYLCYGMSKLTEITIPNSVTSIGDDAFYNCSGLTKVNYLGTADKWVEIDFDDYYSNPTYYAKDLYLNNELLADVKITTADSIKNYAFYNCQSIKSVEIGESVTSIGKSAFSGCSGLTSVIWNAKNYKDFSSSTYSPFYDIRSSLTSFTFGNEIEHIPAYLCYGMSKLSEVTIPNSVTSIGSSAFYSCSGLTSITIPNSVTSIGGDAFFGCSGLTKVNYLGTVDEWVEFNWRFGNPASYANDLYINNELVTDVKITSAGSIGDGAFANCKSIKSVEICNSVTSIGKSAFSGCSGLTKVNYLGTIDKWVEFDFDDYDLNPTYYAKDLYINNELLTDVKITTADSIKNYAFYNCQSIKSVEIGESVTSIGEEAFSGCDKLRKVTAYPTTVPSVYENSFAHYNAALYVPCDVYDDYFFDDVFGTFKVTECIAAEEVDAPEKIEIEVDEDNNAIVIWPSTDGAKKYELEISKDGEVFCTLLFNENGQLTSIDFGNRSASVGFQFTVTGLDSASKYAYSMVAMDKKGNELQSYKGTFTTNGYVPGPGEEDEPTSITETLADANITVSGGTISADADFSIYNTIGQNVTAFNRSLQPGVYLVSIGNDIVKVMVH